MRKLSISLLAALLLLMIVPMQLKAAETSPVITASTKANEEAEANALISRLNEIKEMDKSKLTPSEKKILRKEVRSAKERLNAISGGIYISAGALIIILILLIILL